MKIKMFRIHTDTDRLHHDEQVINEFMESVTVKKTATEFVPDKLNYWSVLIYYETGLTPKSEAPSIKASDKISYPSDADLSNEEGLVYNALKQWRNDIAIRTRLQGYMICNNSELVTIAKTRPKTLEDLGKIKGFGSRKLMKYGDDVLALLNSV
jgi:superfamily II DNA helicase RecQ